MARNIYFYHWSSYSSCPDQRLKWPNCHTNALAYRPQLPIPAILSRRFLQYGKAYATSKIEVKSRVKGTPKEKNTDREMKPKVEETPKEKIWKSKINSKVVQYPWNNCTKNKVKPAVQDIFKQKNRATEIKFKVEETPKVKIMKGKIKPQVEVIPNKKIAKSNIKPRVEVTPKKKTAKSKIKAKVAVTPKEKIVTSKIKPFSEKTSSRNINKPKVQETPSRKINKPKVQETPSRKINKPKVQETSKEKSPKSKIKFKVQEAPKENATMNVHQQVTQVLQDYLYYTRGLSFAHARDISLKAPCFVSKLLSIFHGQKHNTITSALQRYLLYNKINEFEPFFESIGIEPGDIHGLLPDHGFHLSENQTLLTTVSTLTNIGFPRHRVGKLYLKQPHLFSSTRELQKKLQLYENSGVSKASLVSVLTWCPKILDDDVYKQFVKITNGLNSEKNRICCLIENRDIQSSILEKLTLLVGIDCPWDEISKLYHTKSEIFINSSEQAFYSIMEMLSSLGLRREDIVSFVLQCPEILQSICLDKKETLEKVSHHFHDFHGCQLNKLLEGTVPTISENEFSILSGERNKNTKLEVGVDGKPSPEKKKECSGSLL